MARLIDSFHNKMDDMQYSDGSQIEREMLELAQKGDVDWFNDGRWPVVYHFSHLRHNILNWYPFMENCRILEIGAGCGALTGLLCEKGAHVTAIELTSIRAQINYERHKHYDNLDIVIADFGTYQTEEKYDYIIVNGVLEYAAFMFKQEDPYKGFLEHAQSMLAENGIILLAIENRIGLKYFAGSREDHTGQWYSGINNYSKNEKVRTFTKNELEYRVDSAGLIIQKFYYPYPDYKFPEEIFTDTSVTKRVPSSKDNHLDATWKSIFDIQSVQGTLIREGVADRFANSFLVEITREKETACLAQNIDYVKVSADRRRELRIATIIDYKNEEVLKMPLFTEGMAHLKKMKDNSALHISGMRMLECHMEERGLVFPYVTYQSVEGYIQKLLLDGKEEEAIAYVKDLAERLMKDVPCSIQEDDEIFASIFGDTRCEIPLHWINNGNVDMIADNLLLGENGFVIMDYEWIFNECKIPVEYVIWRMIWFLSERSGLPIKTTLYSRLKISNTIQRCCFKWEQHFIEKYINAVCINKLSQPVYDREKVLEQNIKELQVEITRIQNAYDEISNAYFWKISAPLRKAIDYWKPRLRKYKVLRLPYRTLKYIKQYGFKTTGRKIADYVLSQRTVQTSDEYTKEDYRNQRRTEFSKNIKFSIVVPLYNTPERFLKEMIKSVLKQTYINWELCLADGSDDQYEYVGKICHKYAIRDKRIKYRKLEKNMGISGNTNACIEMATGEYIALFDHDDLLHPAALYENMCAICEKDADFIYTDESTFHSKPKDAYCPHFKPDYAPDTLRSYNYICHFTVFKRSLLEEIGEGFRSKYDGSQDYDMILRLTEKAKRIVHVPKILYFWRSHSNSVASDVAAKPYTIDAAREALSEHLIRVGLEGEVRNSSISSTYRIEYKIKDNPLISILIPNKDHLDDLAKCIESIRNKSTYSNWEIIVIENNSTEQRIFDYYEELKKDKRIRVVFWNGEFNYSAINNFGARFASGEYYLLLNNDIEVITPDWLEQMLMFAQREDIGAVGSMLYYPDDTVQHAGVILGIGGVAGHAHKHFKRDSHGYMSRQTIAQNYSAVTAACLMIRKSVFNRIGGLDEGFKVAFNDIDLCMRIRKAGYLIVWTPYAELYHYESKSRGLENTPEKQARFSEEVMRFKNYWQKELDDGDPYYNPHLTLEREDFSY